MHAAEQAHEVEREASAGRRCGRRSRAPAGARGGQWHGREAGDGEDRAGHPLKHVGPGQGQGSGSGSGSGHGEG